MVSQKFYSRWLRPIIWIAGIITSIVVITFIGLYIYKFSGRSVSSNNQDFAFFATYMSGTVGICLTFFNTMFIVYMNAKIHKDDHQRYLSQLRINSYREIIAELHKYTDAELEKGKLVPRLLDYLRETDLHNLLFLSRKENDTIQQKQKKLIASLRNFMAISATDNYENFRRQLLTCLADKNELINYIRKIMMAETDE